VNSASSAPPPAVAVTQETVIGDPLPATPALTSGTYDVVGIVATNVDGQVDTHVLTPSDLRIAVDASNSTYTLQFDPAVFPDLTADGAPAGELAYTITDDRYGHQYSVVDHYSDGRPSPSSDYTGTTASVDRSQSDGDPQNTRYTSHTGESYVSLGMWERYGSQKYSSQPPVAFAYGERTPAADLPISGTATYSSTAILPEAGHPQEDTSVKLTADFGAKSIEAQVSIGYCCYGASGDGTNIYQPCP